MNKGSQQFIDMVKETNKVEWVKVHATAVYEDDSPEYTFKMFKAKMKHSFAWGLVDIEGIKWKNVWEYYKGDYE